MKIMFDMSCGHAEEREVADYPKYYKLDRAYYKAQGLCSACRAALHEEYRRYKATQHGLTTPVNEVSDK